MQSRRLAHKTGRAIREQPRKKLQRAGAGAAAGGLLGLLAVLLGLDSSLGPAQRDRFIFEVLGGAIVTGSLLAAFAGSRENRGKIISILVGAAAGMLIGTVAAMLLTLVSYRWSRSMLEASVGITVFGGVVGAILGRTRHKDPLTLVELMSEIALICALLALFLRMP